MDFVFASSPPNTEDQLGVLHWYSRVARHPTLSSFLQEFPQPSESSSTWTSPAGSVLSTDSEGGPVSRPPPLLDLQNYSHLALANSSFRPVFKSGISLPDPRSMPPLTPLVAAGDAFRSTAFEIDPRQARNHEAAQNMHFCKLCPRAFGRQDHLELHMLRHCGERPHACQIPGCGRRFTRFDELKRHMGSKFHLARARRALALKELETEQQQQQQALPPLLQARP
eukprot:m.186588 g.186588  ORF g.186588 m.186588 type:complete len:225 (+) comp53566_c0_seq1:491-1165(+)